MVRIHPPLPSCFKFLGDYIMANLVEDQSTSHYMNKFSTFNSYIDRIARWNKICANPYSSFDDAYQTQILVTVEEIKETIEAVNSFDMKEVIDGVCDIIVTAGHLATLNDSSKIIQLTDSEMKPQNFSLQLDYLLIKVQTIPGLVTYHDVFAIYYMACELERRLNEIISNSVKSVDDYMVAVLESNDSKIIKINKEYPIAGQSILAQEETSAIKKYGEQWPDIITVKSKYEDKNFEYHVLRANYGTGKILKPLMYQHPAFFYHD